MYPDPLNTIPSELESMGDINASPIDFNSFLATANQYITAMANQAKEKARQTAQVTGMGRSGIPAAAAAGIDQATLAQLTQLANQVTQKKAEQQEEQAAYEEQKSEQQQALDAEKAAGQNMGIAQLGGAALGAVIPGLNLIPGLEPKDLWKNILTGAAVGGEAGGSLEGLKYGKTPSISSSLALLNQANQPKQQFNMDDFLKFLSMFQGNTNPSMPALPAPTNTSYSTPAISNIG